MAVKEWQTIHNTDSVVTLTWPHRKDLSKNDVESQVRRTQDNHSAVKTIFLTINGQKNTLTLMKEFGFLLAVDGFRNERRDVICANAAMILSDIFWFGNVTSTHSKSFRFAGGCLIHPNQLVIKFVSSSYQRGNSDDEKDEGEVTPMTCSNDSTRESIISLN